MEKSKAWQRCRALLQLLSYIWLDIRYLVWYLVFRNPPVQKKKCHICAAAQCSHLWEAMSMFTLPLACRLPSSTTPLWISPDENWIPACSATATMQFFSVYSKNIILSTKSVPCECASGLAKNSAYQWWSLMSTQMNPTSVFFLLVIMCSAKNVRK